MSLFFAPRKSHASPLRRAKTKTMAVLEQLETRQLLSALVQTDKVDYAPNTVATFTALNDANPGANFAAGETINFHIDRTDGTPVESPPAVQDWTVVNGPDGTVSTNWLVDAQFAGASLTVTATGVTSGATATEYFTDAVNPAIITKGSFTPPLNNISSISASPGWTPIGDITITEGSPGTFQRGTDLRLVLDAPAGWQFKPGTGTIQASAGDTSHYHILSITSSQVTVQLDVDNNGHKDVMVIKGLQVQATTDAVPDSGSIHPHTTPAWMTGVTTTTDFCDLSQISSVQPTTTVVFVLPGSYTYGNVITVAASVDSPVGAPSDGTVDFYSDNIYLGTSTVSNGLAQFDVQRFNAGAHSIHAVYSGTSDFTGSQSTDTGVVVNPKALTFSITANDKTYDGSTYAWTMGSLAGVISGDDVYAETSAASFADKNVGQNKLVSLVNITIAGNDAANYTVNATATDTANITPRGIGGTFTAADKVYDGTTDATVLATSLAGVQGSDDVHLTGGAARFTWAGAGRWGVVLTGTQLTGADANNYFLVGIVWPAATIMKADAAITVTGYDVTYDGNAHIATGEARGVNGELLNGLDLSATQHTNAGVYTDPWTFTDVTGNYNNVSGDASGHILDRIFPNTVTLTVVNDGGVYNGSPYATTVTVNGAAALEGISPIVSYQRFDGNAWSTMDTVPTDAGHYLTWATFPGSENWYYAGSDPVYFDITKADVTITVAPYDVTYNGFAHQANTIIVNGAPADQVMLGMDFGGTTHTSAGTYTDTWTFTDTTGNYNDAEGTVLNHIAKVDLTLVALDKSKVYDGQPVNFGPNDVYAFGFVNGETWSVLNGDPGFTGPAVEAVHAGQYTITPTVGTLTATNYNFATFVDGTLTISKADASGIEVLPYNLTYDGASHTSTGVNPVGDLDLSNTTHTNAGTYTDTWFFHGGNDYNDTQGTVTNVISKANATINVTPFSVTYDGNAHNATAIVTGVLGETLASLSGASHTNAGTYDDSVNFTDTTGNYNDTDSTFTDTIAKANAAISIAPYNVTYDGAWHVAANAAYGVKGEVLGGLVVNSAHIDAGYYTDNWSFTDQTGNYNNAGGLFGNNIARANAYIVVNGYTVDVDGANHAATGAAYGVNGAPIAGLDLNGTVHSNVGTHYDTWTFNNPNYNYASGTVVDIVNPARVSIVRVYTEMVPVLVKYQKTKHGLKPVYKKVQVIKVQYSGAVTTNQRLTDYALESTPLCGKAKNHPVALAQVRLTASNTVQLTTVKPLQLHPMQTLTIGTRDSIGRALVGKVVATFNRFGTWLS